MDKYQEIADRLREYVDKSAHPDKALAEIFMSTLQAVAADIKGLKAERAPVGLQLTTIEALVREVLRVQRGPEEAMEAIRREQEARAREEAERRTPHGGAFDV